MKLSFKQNTILYTFSIESWGDNFVYPTLHARVVFETTPIEIVSLFSLLMSCENIWIRKSDDLYIYIRMNS